MAGHSQQPSGSLAGRWHLVAAECPDDPIPPHRVALVFHDEPDGVRGAILSRATAARSHFTRSRSMARNYRQRVQERAAILS
jgi:hypothetical protein